MKTIQYPMHNTRRAKRAKIHCLVRFRDAHAKDSPFLLGNTKDLSTGGMMLWSDKAPGEGSLLDMEFVIPPLNRTFSQLARVKRVRAAFKGAINYIAVAFIEMSRGDFAVLEEFIETLSRTREAKTLFDRDERVNRIAGSGS